MFGIKLKIYNWIGKTYAKYGKNADLINLADLLHKIRLNGLEMVDISYLIKLKWASEGGAYNERVNLGTACMSLRDAIFYDYYDQTIEIEHGEQGLLYACIFPSYYYSRNDYIGRYKKVIDLINNKICILGEKKKLNLSIKRLSKVIEWLFQLSDIKGGINYKLFILAYIIEAWQIVCILDQIMSTYELKRSLVLCDYNYVDNVVVQYLKAKGVETISLQHGVYTKGSIKYICNSVADKELVFGQQAFDIFVEAGVSGDRLVKCGMPQLIGLQNNKKNLRSRINRIGIVMSQYYGDKDDLNLLSIVKDYFAHRNIKLYLKIRNGEKKDYYVDYVNDSFERLYSDDIDSVEFVEGMDLIICGSSTLVIESVTLGVPVLVYSGNGAITYPELREFVFFDKDSLHKLMNNCIEEFDSVIEKLDDVKKYYCEENVEDKYRSFLI